MKTFRVSYECADTCGNTWVDDKDPVKYLQADNISKVWEHFKKPRITKYETKGGKCVMFIRTPKGKGYGIWEDNPEFDFEKELNANNLVAIETGGFRSMIVSEVATETIL